MSSEFFLIAGLGNPGPAYVKTRHNAGFMLLDGLLTRFNAEEKDWKGPGRYARINHKGKEIFLVRPMTYMNESGKMVSSLANFYKIPPAQILVCFDDMSIDLGDIRLRAGGSAGGQKGMISIINSLGTQQIPRLRIGIGPRPANIDAADFVLSKFRSSEQQFLSDALVKAQDAALEFAESGIEKAMNKFN